MEDLKEIKIGNESLYDIDNISKFFSINRQTFMRKARLNNQKVLSLGQKRFVTTKGFEAILKAETESFGNMIEEASNREKARRIKEENNG